MSYTELVEAIQHLPFDQKQELHDLIARYLIEERREEIMENYQLSMQELKSGTPDFSSNLNELRGKMAENGD